MALPIGGDTQTVHLSEKAFDLMADYFQEHEKFLVGEGQAISDWASKYIGAVLRIAGLLHCADMEDDKTEVTASTMSKAIQIGKYFLAHSTYASTFWPSLVLYTLCKSLSSIIFSPLRIKTNKQV